MAFMTERLKRLLIIGAVAILLAGTVSLWFSLSPTQRAWRYYLAGAKISCCGEPDPIAIKHFKKALQLNPRLFEARRGLAAIYANIGGKRDAAALYQEAMRIEPSDPRPRYELAELALPEQPEKAIRHLKDYLSLCPNDLQAWYLLAQCYEAGKQWKEALWVWESIARRFPDEARAKRSLRRVRQKMSQAKIINKQSGGKNPLGGEK